MVEFFIVCSFMRTINLLIMTVRLPLSKALYASQKKLYFFFRNITESLFRIGAVSALTAMFFFDSFVSFPI